MIKPVNLNNGATSARKPDTSINEMAAYLTANNQNNPGRGGTLNEDRLILNTRLELCTLFNVKKPEQVIFTNNITTALNMVIYGFLQKGDHVITTSMEHNGVVRPLTNLAHQQMIDVSYVDVNAGEIITPEKLEGYLNKNTKMMIMTHASNVTGTVYPYEACAKWAKEKGLFFVLDTAQTAGVYDIDFQQSAIDVLAFTGHKSLMGPMGTGGFIIKEESAKKVRPILSGGTGSMSHLLTQPEFLPDKFESGTPNVLGIMGLGASVAFINQNGTKKIREHERALTDAFLQGLAALPVTIYGHRQGNLSVPTISITVKDWDMGILCDQLYETYQIITRSGLHCAPLAHKTIGTYPDGTLRFSFGYFTTKEEIDYGLSALRDIICH